MKAMGLLWVCVALLGACKKDGAGTASGSGGLSELLASAVHGKLAAAAKEAQALAASKKCDEAMAKAQEAVSLIREIAPSLVAVAKKGAEDKPYGDYVGDLYAIRVTLEMSARSYAREKPGALDMRPHYCQAAAKDLAKVKQPG